MRLASRHRRRLIVGSLAGALLLSSWGGSAALAADEDDNAGVDVDVNIAPIDEPGVLAMSVAAGAVTLTEQGSTALIRQFTGSLPTVTVTDTRTAAEIPDGAAWYVVGTASAFTGTGGQSAIGAGNLGWRPHLINGGEQGLVAEGDEVVTVVDQATLPGNNVGLVDQELLAMAADSESIATEGTWTANADLFLRVPSSTAPGQYRSVVTLSLFE